MSKKTNINEYEEIGKFSGLKLIEEHWSDGRSYIVDLNSCEELEPNELFIKIEELSKKIFEIKKEKYMKNLNNRKEKLVVIAGEIRKTKNEIKETQRRNKYACIDYTPLNTLKEQVRYLGIIHTILKRRKDIDFLNIERFKDDDFNEILMLISELGIERKWKSDNKKPKISGIKEALKLL